MILHKIIGLVLILFAAVATGGYFGEWLKWRNHEGYYPTADKLLITICCVAIALHWWISLLGGWR